MKKFFSLVLALVMALSLTTVAWGADVAAYGGTNYGSLQDAIDAAEATGGTITLLADCGEDVVVEQAPNVAIVIDGANKTYTGTITVDGKSAAYPTAALKIQNVNFDATSITKDACINMGGTNAMRYISNLTVTGCTFSYSGSGDVVAVKSYTGGDKHLTIEGCIVNSGMHSLLQVKNVETGVKITGCKVYSKEGINLNSTPALEMSSCEFDVQGYAVRVGVNGTVNTTEKSFTITDSTLKSACADGDAVIVFRDDAKKAEVTITDTTLTGTTTFAGNDDVTDITVDGVPTDAVAQVGSDYYKTVADAIAAANGAPVVLLDPSATIPAGYTALKLTDGTYIVVPTQTFGDKYDLYLANVGMQTALKNKTPDVAGLSFAEKPAHTNQDGSGNVAYIAANNGQFFVKTTNPTVADYAVTYAGKTDVLYYVKLSTVVSPDAFYYAEEVKAFTNWGMKCGQINNTGWSAALKAEDYFVGPDFNVYMAVAATSDEDTNYLLDGAVVSGSLVGAPIDHHFVASNFKYDAATGANVPTAALCTTCTQTTTAIYKIGKAPANAVVKPLYVNGAESDIWEVVPVAAPSVGGAVVTPSTDKVTSAETFDAGIAMYVGMSVLAAAGSAVVIGKKKD